MHPELNKDNRINLTCPMNRIYLSQNDKSCRLTIIGTRQEYYLDNTQAENLRNAINVIKI